MHSTETQIRPTPMQRDLLAGKAALVTGASRGIGAAAARAFAHAGAAVVLAARDGAALATVAREIQAGGGRALAVPTDVGDPEAVERLIARSLDAYGRLDAAFNNAGAGQPPVSLADIAVGDWERSIRVNLTGVFLCMKYEIPALLANGGGAIVNMSSTAGLAARAGLAAYSAAKHGVIGLTKAAAQDYAAHGVRVNALAPGPILSDQLSRLSAEVREQIARTVPAQRLGRPEEVAAAAVWLCSDQAAFITGATIVLDGGRLSGGA